jgi:hypothetical protein
VAVAARGGQNDEHANMHLTYCFCNKNGTAVVEYLQQYPLHGIPHCTTYKNAYKTFRDRFLHMSECRM